MKDEKQEVIEVEIKYPEAIASIIESQRGNIESRIQDALADDQIEQIVKSQVSSMLHDALLHNVEDIAEKVIEKINNSIDILALQDKASEVITQTVNDVARDKTRDIGHFAIRDAVGEKCKELAEQSVHEVMAEVDIEEVKQQLRAQAKMVLGQDMNELLRQEIGLLYDRLKELSGEVNILRNEIQNRPSK